MKKLMLVMVATVAMAGAASAADLAARPYTKAPIAAPAVNWTGCYVGAGGGGAMTKNDHNDFDTATGAALGPNQTTGASGWLATVQGGCDYQFAGTNWLIGGFADYDFMDVRGDISTFGTAFPTNVGRQKQDYQWAVGARVGYLVTPQLLTYLSGGYTQAHWTATNMVTSNTAIGAAPTTLPGGTKGGWFIGAGDEYALTSFLPGLFWKTEYRYSEFDRSNVAINFTATGTPFFGTSETQKFREHSVRSELVYRFNWAGPVVAKY
ncbi:outer membrane protein [Bradyrhizobium sp. GCM10027634]|uniref:outer membrane protein n=1 Tax=unclassified Bradyrhizobium TaxID=2631580 RepID=UPI00188AD3C3|nr:MULTISPECIES: outer membrane beta-barrel protein [unclassified Bradyrhizobium]MDN5002003.1 outer membrane beta-barrel protein [Bradyrhizobium sp. WYCCWR 12677]QOZ45718.1 porin family protein [Bradyrhizobium sp. CCBAU 53340]